ncbi:hypothetical protein FJR38_00570 [Anabaena sp. UHCC 0253]|uniref:hypothetical protein n=1 Tax=Anabaena sp. UHCC 0253 TaxID=2590019 RepID=UPI001446E845|nr:hypothetical protein [Anabaena sp. UHCC 0253]MTJ51284.1 hypothetical protein [Anabaena sp. UHCC 0253]
MAAIIISDLKLLEEETFFHNLNSEEIQQILGNGLLPFFGSANPVQLATVFDGINNRSTSYRGPFGIYDNKIFTVDFSRTAIFLVV